MSFDPYLMFDGDCRAAFTRYHEIFGGDLTIIRMGDAPDAEAPADQADLVIHAALNVGGRLLMGSDDPTGGNTGAVERSYVYHDVPDVATADKVYDALADGGEATQPLMETFFSPRWGMCVDRWGVCWMVGVPGPQTP